MQTIEYNLGVRTKQKKELEKILASLTVLEKNYLALYMQGKSSNEIDKELNITNKYADKMIRRSIMQKFNVERLILAAFCTLQTC